MKTISTFFCCALLLIVFPVRAAETALPSVQNVEWQPFVAQVKRVIEAMDYQGSPLSEPDRRALETILGQTNNAADRVQEILDRHCLFFVNINGEMRVKVSQGLASPELLEQGWRQFLVKVQNEAGATAPLRASSPNAQRLFNSPAADVPNRWLDLQMFDSQPLKPALSGLELEYRIIQLYSRDAGRREAKFSFNVGQGTQDLGFRNETDILFRSAPAREITLRVRDENDQPTTASFVVRDQQRRVYPSPAKRLAPDFAFHPQIYRADGETVLLPPGEFQVQSGRGPEYWVRQSSLVVYPDGKISFHPVTNPPISGQTKPVGEDRAVEIRLERWVNPRDFGFYSGDHHIHAAGCAHYTSPTEGVTPQDMFRQVKGEALNVGCVLTWGPCFRFQRQYFAAKPHDLSDPLTVLKYDLEISGFGSQALGHVCLLNLQDQTYPGSDGTETKGWPLWTTPVMRWAKAQGGVTGYAHSASGLTIEPAPAAKRMLAWSDTNQDGFLSTDEAKAALLPEQFAAMDANKDELLDVSELVDSHNRAADRLPNLAIPEMNGVGAMEICVTTAEGVCDFISAMDTRRIQEWNTWYHILNCGFPLKVSGETDFPCMSSRRVGQGRVYVQLEAPIPANPRASIDFSAWCEGLAKGRSYVSDGFAHAIDFRVNDRAPGFDDVKLAESGMVSITAKVVFAPQTPETVAQGTIVPADGQRLVGDTVELHGPRTDRLVIGGERLVEIIVNGQPVASQKVPADGKPHDLKFDVKVARSSWIALRHFPQLHTNPVNVIVANQPIRASRDSARWCDEVIDLLWKNRQKVIPEAERAEALRTFEKARETYRRIALECQQ